MTTSPAVRLQIYCTAGNLILRANLSESLRVGLSDSHSAIDRDGLAGDIARRIGREKDDSSF